MNEPRDEAIDTLLKSALAMEPVADAGFTQGVIDLIGRRRRKSASGKNNQASDLHA